ncbi:MAG: hypothetical protein CMD99_08940 [Gammaproteobacteria bacterium]|nr:hypothetical protein [Gammaproteobacteria bacterium]|tara:strand:- start:5889 stop:6677 length:789 start_codon:yes stop_codon:yes gene_type:complete
MDWVGVDPLRQVVSRDAAMAQIDWLNIHWQVDIPDFGYYFWWDDKGLSLKSAAFDFRSRVHIDFVEGTQARRIKAVTGEALTRAMGCQKGLRPAIFDATAGLGGDLSVLANVGCAVYAVERQPVVAALLKDALRRHAIDGDAGWCERVQLQCADSRDLMSHISHGVVYIDPMFQKDRKSAPSLSMQVLHTLEGTTERPEQLIDAALDSGAARVVVKRPIRADFLAGRSPSSQVKGKTVRFDLYSRRKLTDADAIPHQGLIDG